MQALASQTGQLASNGATIGLQIQSLDCQAPASASTLVSDSGSYANSV